jgi:hypothetical protein
VPPGFLRKFSPAPATHKSETTIRYCSRPPVEFRLVKCHNRYVPNPFQDVLWVHWWAAIEQGENVLPFWFSAAPGEALSSH